MININLDFTGVLLVFIILVVLWILSIYKSTSDFNDVFINTLLKSDIPPELVNVATTNYQPLTFDTNCNRSVQGTMNQVAQEIDYGLYYKSTSVADINPYRYSADLSHRPCSVKGQKDYIWPDREMAQLLQKLPNTDADSAASMNLH